MYRHMMKSKLHKAIVTQADLHYVGSITIDQNLMDLADMLPDEKVQIVNNNNGARLETYIIPGKRGSGVICLNGAAARLVQIGDEIIIISYGLYNEAEAKSHKPIIVIMDSDNKPAQIMQKEIHGMTL